jgi:geranylgeranyl reductase family protein
MKYTTDCCIIGAGPAGATTSLFLSKAGIDHILLDAAVFPRDKICGDGLDLKVMRVLRHLDPDVLQHEVLENQHFIHSYGTRFITQNGRYNDFIYPENPGTPSPKPLFLIAKRLHFDDFLIRKINPAHSLFLQGTKATNIRKKGNLWHIEAEQQQQKIEITTPLLISADGDHSLVLHSLGERAIQRRHYAAALRQYWKGVEGLHPANLIEVYFPKNLPMSYFYIFPLPNGEANVGYGMVSEIITKDKINLKEKFRYILENDPVMAPRFAQAKAQEDMIGWGLPLASRRRKAFGDGYLLTGDAASLICPTSGEGIGTAMISGYIAAQFIQRALKLRRYDAAVFQHYDREIYRRLQQEIRLYQYMMRLSPRVYDTGLNWLAPNPLLKWYFKKKAPQWLNTAWEKEISVNMD